MTFLTGKPNLVVTLLKFTIAVAIMYFGSLYFFSTLAALGGGWIAIRVGTAIFDDNRKFFDRLHYGMFFVFGAGIFAYFFPKAVRELVGAFLYMVSGGILW